MGEKLKKGSWRTTTTGVLMILGAVAALGRAWFDGDPATVPNFEVAATAIATGIGLIMCRDNKVTSEDAGAAK